MNEHVACEDWPIILEPCVCASTHFKRITVLRETGSTQDAALEFAATPGDIITTFRQTAGRGRLGRAWADTIEHGVAVTFVVPAAAPERLAMLSAIGAARAASALLASAPNPTVVSIKWPNDIVINSRKLAGILVEQDSRMARIGVGMNIAQPSFPAELADRACSLLQLGVEVDRATAVAALIRHMDGAISESDGELTREFKERNCINGRTATFEHNRRTITGRVLDVDPMHGLRVATEAGEVFLPAQTTSLVSMD